MSLHVNIGGAYKGMSDGWVNIGGVWKKINSISTNIGGLWKEGYVSKTFVAVMQSGTVYTSPDLHTWTLKLNNGTTNPVDFGYNPSTNVMLLVPGSSGKPCYISTDGCKTFSTTTQLPTLYSSSLRFINTYFVMYTAITVYYSSDGVTWSSFAQPSNLSDIKAVHYSNGLFIYELTDGFAYTVGASSGTATVYNAGSTTVYNISAHGQYTYISLISNTSTDRDRLVYMFDGTSTPTLILEVDGSSTYPGYDTIHKFGDTYINKKKVTGNNTYTYGSSNLLTGFSTATGVTITLKQPNVTSLCVAGPYILMYATDYYGDTNCQQLFYSSSINGAWVESPMTNMDSDITNLMWIYYV